MEQIIIIGTSHGSLNEQSIFNYLNNCNHQQLKWLCEGENDNRLCCSLKEPTVHLITDSLFVYMVINDLKTVTDPKQHFLYDEMVNRLIELFITIIRQPNRSLKLDLLYIFRQSPIPWDKILVEIMAKSLTQIQLEIAGMKLSDILEIFGLNVALDDMQINIEHIITYLCSEKYKMIDVKYLDSIKKFLKNTQNCIGCEDLIFMKMRDQSFWNLIQIYLKKPKPVTIITVGIDHCEFIANLIKKHYTIPVKKLIIDRQTNIKPLIRILSKILK